MTNQPKGPTMTRTEAIREVADRWADLREHWPAVLDVIGGE